MPEPTIWHGRATRSNSGGLTGSLGWCRMHVLIDGDCSHGMPARSRQPRSRDLRTQSSKIELGHPERCRFGQPSKVQPSVNARAPSVTFVWWQMHNYFCEWKDGRRHGPHFAHDGGFPNSSQWLVLICLAGVVEN